VIASRARGAVAPFECFAPVTQSRVADPAMHDENGNRSVHERPPDRQRVSSLINEEAQALQDSRIGATAAPPFTLEVLQTGLNLGPEDTGPETEEFDVFWKPLREQRGECRGLRGEKSERRQEPPPGCQTLRTLEACRPFGPSTTSKSTVSPSRSDRNPSA